jgi:DNA-binding response OmpR family regulator
MRFLLVDDEPHVGMVIRRVAQGCGFEVRTTSQAADFKAAYETFQPDVITLDLAIPDGDGVELLRFLADAGCTAQIVIISGFDDKVMESAKRLGDARGLKMAGTISKPMRIAELRTLFNTLLQVA